MQTRVLIGMVSLSQAKHLDGSTWLTQPHVQSAEVGEVVRAGVRLLIETIPGRAIFLEQRAGRKSRNRRHGQGAQSTMIQQEPPPLGGQVGVRDAPDEPHGVAGVRRRPR